MGGSLRSALQALSVLQWMLTFLFLGPGAVVLLLLLLRTRLWILPVAYGGWWLWDWNGPETGPRHWDWLRNWRIWDHFCDYFPITVVRECPLPPGRSYLLPAHPHGISCIGVFGAFVSGGRGAAGTPKNGETGTSKIGESGTPKNGDSGTPKIGESGTPRIGESGTPRIGESGTPKNGDTGTPKNGESGTPKNGDTGTPKTGESGTPKPEDSGTPRIGDSGTPRIGDSGTPKNGDTGTPRIGDSGTPKNGDSGTPRIGDSGTPRIGDSGTPRIGGSGTPRLAAALGPCPGLRPSLAALHGLFRLPLYREYAMAAGLCPVSQRCLDAVLARDSQALLIMVGGAAEALEGTPGCHRVTLRQRRGFVRLALRHGCPLVPVYVFGEQDAFRQPALAEGSWLRRLQRGLKRILGFAPCLFWGRGGLPFLPFRVPLTVVVGTPLEVPRVPRPSPELVAHYHGLYVQRLQELFERHKVACGVSPETPLIIA